MTTTRIKEKLSSLISTQLPEHITSDFPTFRLFLEKYYEFIEQDQNAQELIQNARSYADIDTTIDSFIDYFINQYAKDFPKSLVLDKTLFIKYVRELYLNKGTEDAFRILFRILFNEEIDFFYPNEVIFKSSDGKWEKPYVLRASPIAGSPFEFSGTKITGNTSNAFGIVESVLSYSFGTDVVYEIYLNPYSIKGTFLAGENILAKQLTNVTTGTYKTITANLYPIVTKIDVIEGGLGYILDQAISITGPNGVGASGVISSVTDAGTIREITLSNYGYGYDVRPNVDVGAPTATVIGRYKIESNVATIRLANNHSLVVGSNANITFTANADNDLNGTTKELTVSSIPNLKTIVIANIASYRTGVITSRNVNTRGNVTLTYTINRFINGRYILSDNVVRVGTSIEHGLRSKDNANVIFNKTDVESHNGHFRLRNYNNVTVGFNESHNFVVNDSINVTFDSRYTNTNTGTYVIRSYPGSSSNIANIYFGSFQGPSRHSFSVGQNVNVLFGLSYTNAAYGTFVTVGNVGLAYFTRPHSFVPNDSVNVTFTNAVLTNDEDKQQIAGTVSISKGSNILVGDNTYFQSNIFAGNVIVLNFTNTFTVANVVSNTLAYMRVNSRSNINIANAYISTSNLNGNSTTTKIILFGNSTYSDRRLFFYVDANTPGSKGNIVVSNNVSNSLVNTYMTAVVVGNGRPRFTYVDLAIPSGFPNTNAIGFATVTNEDTSNVIGNSAYQVKVLSVPNNKTIIFNSNISSNSAASNGLITINTDLPGDIEDYANSFAILTVPNFRTVTFESANANTRGNVTLYYFKEANLQANIGALAIGSGRWLDDSSKLDETHKIQGRIGTDDRVYYQPFSYVIRSSQTLSTWRDTVKKLLHPAGFEIFGDVVISTKLNNVQNATARAIFFPIKITGNIDASFTTITVDSTEYTMDNLKLSYEEEG